MKKLGSTLASALLHAAFLAALVYAARSPLPRGPEAPVVEISTAVRDVEPVRHVDFGPIAKAEAPLPATESAPVAIEPPPVAEDPDPPSPFRPRSEPRVTATRVNPASRVQLAPPPGPAAPVLHGAELIASPVPTYPTACRRRGIEGEVVVELLVGEDGAVREAKVRVSSGCEELDAAALAAVKAARYRPARRDGAPVAASDSIRYVFRLE